MNFFEKFEQAKYEFTYGEEDDPENRNVLQVGLVAWFYLDKAYTQENRARMAQAFRLYQQEYGDKLKTGYFDDPNKMLDYTPKNTHNFAERITNSYGDNCDFFWCSTDGFDHAGDYWVGAGSPAGWYELAHSRISYFGFYLPVSELKDTSYLAALLKQFCIILQPMHGLMGLGVQQCFENHRYQHLEYEIGQEFLGIDIPGGLTDKRLRNGLRTINWQTFFNTQWLDKLGGIAHLKSVLPMQGIEITEYLGGVIIQAGEYPELGWIKDNPYPSLYLAVNEALKLIRAPEIDSLGYGSIAGEIRFDKRSTQEWLARFDKEPYTPPESLPSAPVEKAKERVTRYTDEIAPYTGRWGCIVNGTSQFVHLEAGKKLPFFEDKKGKKHHANWSLLERDDKGSVFIEAED